MYISLLRQSLSARSLLFLVIIAFGFLSCRDGSTSQSSGTRAITNNQTSNTNTITNTNNTIKVNSQGEATSLQGESAGGQFHYICVNNCEGSGANAAGNCPVCGEALVHNTAFHSGGSEKDQSPPQILGNGDNTFSSKINPLGSQANPSQPAPPTATGNPAFHYICSAGCGGGGSAQGSCPSCGAELVHNTTFHSAQGATSAQGASGIQTSKQKYPSIFNTPGAATPAPAQNRLGVFHYICSKGCGGGGNAQGSCPSCGASLVHNTAFHQ